jgi:FkbM family methyltransferase
MKLIDNRASYLQGKITKPEYVSKMYEIHHSKLFDYAEYLKQTNIASIEITDKSVVMTSRDRSIRMECPLGDHRVAPIESLNFLDYESEDSAMILNLSASANCVLDIGANIGWYSINIAKSFPSCEVHAFEPIPKTYAYLVRNIRLNKLENIYPHPFGLSNERKDVHFYFYPEGSGNASSANLSERSDAEVMTCHVERLDDFVIANEMFPDFIKCDVEGAELFVFQGAVEILKRDKPIVFTEMLRKWSAKFNYHPNDIINLFLSIGYRCFFVSDARLKEIYTMTEETIQTNFFFLHENKHRNYIDEYLIN